MANSKHIKYVISSVGLSKNCHSRAGGNLNPCILNFDDKSLDPRLRGDDRGEITVSSSSESLDRLGMTQAFTLIEVIIATAVISGIVFASVGFFGAVLAGRAKTKAAQEVHDATRIASALITKRIRSAATVVSASSTFGVSPGVLTLSMADSALNPTVINVSGNSVLQITEGTSAPVSVTSNDVSVTNLVFTQTSYPGSSGGITLDMTIAYRNPDADPNYSYSLRHQTLTLLRP